MVWGPLSPRELTALVRLFVASTAGQPWAGPQSALVQWQIVLKVLLSRLGIKW